MKQMKIDYNKEKKLAQMLPGVSASVMKSPKNGIFPEEMFMLSDIRDYFMYLVVRCSDKEEAIEIIERLFQYSEDIEKIDAFHAAFYVILVNILQLRFEIMLLPGEMVTYDAFEISLAKNFEKFQNKY